MPEVTLQDDKVVLPRSSNQALGLGEYAIAFLNKGAPHQEVLDRTAQFFADATLCGLSALALKTNAPTLLRAEALDYPDPKGATVYGSSTRVKAEKACAANGSAVREWDSNGTNFGFRPELGHSAGEFGHNDFYGVAVAACQEAGRPGKDALLGMVLIDEIRGRLAEVFSLKTFKIDHVVHGAIASAAVYGALRGATAEQIESAIGMTAAHYIPWRAIRAGKQLSDSKGASAALSTEVAVLSMKRAIAGFLGPRDIFRNPEAVFRQFSPTSGDSPFDLHLSLSGDDFAVMGMHFKLGLYEHQSAGAIQGLINLISQHRLMLKEENLASLLITAYEPAFGIIGDPAKRNPTTRQSADHSMLYIIATLLRKAIELGDSLSSDPEEAWRQTMLMPSDYGREAIDHPVTRRLIEKISFAHGGADYDSKYPEGIPTSVQANLASGDCLDSGLIMFPTGHARSASADLQTMLGFKFKKLASLALPDGSGTEDLIQKLLAVGEMSASRLLSLNDLQIADRVPVD